MEVDNKTLTLFLIGCMTEMFERNVKTSDVQMVPGTSTRGLKKDKLKYLEIIAGTTMLSRIDVFIYVEGRLNPIFGMNIVSRLDMDEIGRCKLNFVDVLRALENARKTGFAKTREAIGQNKHFCLFDIPPHKEPAPVEAGGVPGTFLYGEDIEDALDFFGGGEEIFFQPDAHGRARVSVFRSQIQGCRLL